MNQKAESQRQKLVTVLGTRPEIIKLSPLIPLLDKYFKHIIIHTGQHYSPEMSTIFFKDLRLRQPDYNIHVGSGNHGYQVGSMMIRIEKILFKEKPKMVIVQGDTNSTLAGALVASKSQIKVVHIESGGRSGNRDMPEEINRIIVDHLADILIAYDEQSKANLIKEGIEKKKIFKLQNTSYEACKRNITYAKESNILEKLDLKNREYAVLTLHRAENTNNRNRLESMTESLNSIADNKLLVFPVHPRTKKMIENYGFKLNYKIMQIEPIGYLDFLNLLIHCTFIISDSGGIQDEAVALNKPLFIIRNEIEQKWIVDEGKAVLVGTTKDKILKNLNHCLLPENLKCMIDKKVTIDYNVAENIIKIIKEHISG